MPLSQLYPSIYVLLGKRFPVDDHIINKAFWFLIAFFKVEHYEAIWISVWFVHMGSLDILNLKSLVIMHALEWSKQKIKVKCEVTLKGKSKV